LDRKTGKGVSEVEEEIHKGTGISSARLRQKNEDRSKCIGLCDRRSFIHEI